MEESVVVVINYTPSAQTVVLEERIRIPDV